MNEDALIDSTSNPPPSQIEKEPRGQALPEYALILVLVAVVAVAALGLLGNGVANSISNVNDTIAMAITPYSPPTRIGSGPGDPDDDNPTDLPPTSQPTATPDATTTSPEPTDDGAPGEGFPPAPTNTPDSGSGSGPSLPGDPTDEPEDPEPTQAATATSEPPTATFEPPTDIPTDAPTSTPIPLPTAAPTATPIPDEFFDEFDGDGNIEWTTVAGRWTVSNGAFGSTDPNAGVMSAIPFDDYDFYADVETVSSSTNSNTDVTMLVFRIESASSFYAVMLRKDDRVELAKNTSSGWQSLKVAWANADPMDNHRFRIRLDGRRIRVYVDGTERINYRDNSNPILSGGIGFANQASSSRIDNVEISDR